MQARLGFLASHGGSAMAAILRAVAGGSLAAEPRVAVCNNSDAPALALARAAGLPALHISAWTHGTGADAAVRDALLGRGVNLVVLSGYMKKLGPLTLDAFAGRILNMHPSLLPDFGGQSMYGRRVHEAVVAAGARRTGATIHLVDEHYDHGAIVAQREIRLRPGEPPASVEARVRALEGPLFVDTLRELVAGRLRLPAGIPPQSAGDASAPTRST